MTNEKWHAIYNEEVEKFMCKLGLVIGPTVWPKRKQLMLELINEVDKLTEVYNMEKGE
jgi:hypothetical protein